MKRKYKYSNIRRNKIIKVQSSSQKKNTYYSQVLKIDNINDGWTLGEHRERRDVSE